MNGVTTVSFSLSFLLLSVYKYISFSLNNSLIIVFLCLYGKELCMIWPILFVYLLLNG